MRNGNGNVLSPMMSTFLEYWERCESLNTYIVENSNLICKHNDGIVWTGLRRYKIGKSIELTST